ncbi:MAG TPA: stage II sporulation protein M [Burkholderiales bacterium]|nr:stage II sporulation protein M [Burkholderiales bacterium]
MKQAPFEASRGPEWDAFERFLDARGKSEGALPVFPPAEMPQRYRRLCQSLALAADRRYSPDLVDRLNQLSLRGHRELYANRGRQTQRAADFLLVAFPSLVRREWRLVAAAALLFFGPLLVLIAVLQYAPEFVYYILGPREIANFHEMYDPANHRLGMREADTSLAMFGVYIWNNIRIGFQTFAGGILAGVGSVWFLAANGVIIGSVAGYLTQVGYAGTFWPFVAGHSSLELTAIVLSGAAGLRLGLAVISPGNVSRKAALVAAARPAVRMMYGAAVMFALAAFVEAFWSPLSEIPFEAKIGLGVAGWLAVLGYLGLAGRSRGAG